MMQFDHSEEKPGLHIDETAKAYLLEAARWAKFIAIFGIVICGIMLMGGLFFMMMGSVAAGMYAAAGLSPFVLGVIYIACALIYIYPAIALLRFSIRVKEALLLGNNDVLNNSFRFLKNHFKSIGILIIITIFVYALLFLFIIVVGGVALMSA